MREVWHNEEMYKLRNNTTIFAVIGLLIFPLCSYGIEKLAARKLPEPIVFCLVSVLITVHMIYPVVMIQVLESHFLMSTYFMVFTVGQLLKLCSFHHVLHDNRYLLNRMKQLGDNQEKTQDQLSSYYNISAEQMDLALQYPRSVTFSHYFRFLMAPTCCYQLHFPLTDSIRWSFVLKRVIELIVGNTFALYLIYQHMIPCGELGIQPIRNRDYMTVFVLTLQMAVPAAYFWLTMFYCVFHSYLNLFAELTRFADRRFYSDWWNANNLSEYWRKWNQPIHNFLIRHVYYPCRRRGISSATCMLLTFTLSAAFHEYIMIGILSVCNFIAFIIMMANVPLMLLQRQLGKRVSGNMNNLMFWLFYIVLGQPFGILFSYY